MPYAYTCRGCGAQANAWNARRICARCAPQQPPLVIVSYADRPSTLFVTRAPGRIRTPQRALPNTIDGSRIAVGMLLADA